MKIYKSFIKALVKNYLIGTSMAIIGVIIGINIATYQISVQDFYVFSGILIFSIFIMSTFEYLSFRSYIRPIKIALTEENISIEVFENAYLQTHRLPSLSGFRILGPRFIGLAFPMAIQMTLAINLQYLELPYLYIGYTVVGVLIVVGVHAMIEFYLTSNAIQPVITELKKKAKEQHQYRLSLNGKMLVSIRTKFLMSSTLIGAFPIILFGLATMIQIEHLLGDSTERYLFWGIFSLVISFSLGSYGAWLLYSYITNPLKQLNEKMNEVKAGNYHVEAHDFYSDEFSKVISGFNHMVRGLKEKEEKNQQLIESFFTTLATILDARDHYTAGHSVRVANFAVEIGKRAGMNKQQLSILKKSALLHDIGKIGVPDEILLKDGKLTEDEYKQIQEHSSLGETIMKNIHPREMIKPLLSGIRSHHERIDGAGYPDQLMGDEIPINGRIIAVADAFDAMTSDRPYRKGMEVSEAMAILESGKGSQWDEAFVNIFLNWLKQKQNAKPTSIE